jgi:hypothetical protein
MRLILPLVLSIAAIPCLGAEMHVLAGTGTMGYSGDGGPAMSAETNQPFGLIRGKDGAIYFCDTLNHRVRKIAADGKISTVAGNGQAGYAGDGGPALQASLKEPYEIRFDRDGNLFIVERLNHTIRKVDATTRTISTVAGTGKAGFGGDGGPGPQAQLNEPHSIQFDPAGKPLCLRHQESPDSEDRCERGHHDLLRNGSTEDGAGWFSIRECLIARTACAGFRC